MGRPALRGARHSPEAAGFETLDRLVEALEQRDHARLEAILHPNATYVFVGMPAVQGRREVVGYWRRLFATISNLEVSVQRRMREGPVVVVEYLKRISGLPGGRLTATAVAVLTLEDDRIRTWSDGYGMPDLSPEQQAWGARLRSDRW